MSIKHGESKTELLVPDLEVRDQGPVVSVVGLEKEGRISIRPWDYLNKQLPLIAL